MGTLLLNYKLDGSLQTKPTSSAVPNGLELLCICELLELMKLFLAFSTFVKMVEQDNKKSST